MIEMQKSDTFKSTWPTFQSINVLKHVRQYDA
nr:hypothetical protein [Spodoptera litura nucleopolyhedrovirus]